MKIVLNGNACELAPVTTLAALLEANGYGGRKVAVEINREIVPKSQHAQTLLRAGDRIEIVNAMGGG